MVLGLVPDALELRNLSSSSLVNFFVNFCELFEGGLVERETRFELATTCLEGRYSTTELLPLTFKYYVKKGAKASCALMNLDTVLLRS